jgi:hypothetical protein
MVFTRDGDGFVGGEVKEGVVRERASNSSETWKGENFGREAQGGKERAGTSGMLWPATASERGMRARPSED